MPRAASNADGKASRSRPVARNQLDQLMEEKRVEAEALSAEPSTKCPGADTDSPEGLRIQGLLASALDSSLASGELASAITTQPQRSRAATSAEIASEIASTSTRRYGWGQGGPSSPVNQTLPPLSPQALVLGTRAAQRSAQKSAQRTVSPSLPVRRLAGTGTRHDPAKLERRSDGRMNMMGVRAVSDVSLYNKLNPYSRKAFEIRKAFKMKQYSGHAMPATKTWGAVTEWHASSKSFDDFVTEARTGVHFHQGRVAELGGFMTTSCVRHGSKLG